MAVRFFSTVLKTTNTGLGFEFFSWSAESSTARHTSILEVKLVLQQAINQAVSATFTFFQPHHDHISFSLFSFVHFNQSLLRRDCV